MLLEIHAFHTTFKNMRLFMLKKYLIEKSFEDRKMHLTVYPAAYSIIALKAREWKTVKVLHTHASCRGSEVIIFHTCPGQFVSVWHSASL